MRVFVTGATGWVGSAVIQELRTAGHAVVGLARSDASAAELEKLGVGVRRGSLEDIESLRAGAVGADAVVHAAFNGDLTKFAENAAVELRAIEALGGALAGTRKTLVVTSGVAMIKPGQVVTEDDSRDSSVKFPRDPETAATAVAKRGVHVSVVRLSPCVHGAGETHGFLPLTIAAARAHGVSAYVDKGENRWAGVARRDAARLFRLALERSAEHAVYHAVAEEGVRCRDIADAIGRKLDLPVVSVTGPAIAAHFGEFAPFAQIDASASNAKTRAALAWEPIEPGILADLNGTAYFPVTTTHA